MRDEYVRKQDVVSAVEFGITLASAINIETGEWKELFQRENDELRKAVERIKDIKPADVVQVEELKAEIYKLKHQRKQGFGNHDYYVGYISALSTIEGILACIGREE